MWHKKNIWNSCVSDTIVTNCVCRYLLDLWEKTGHRAQTSVCAPDLCSFNIVNRIAQVTKDPICETPQVDRFKKRITTYPPILLRTMSRWASSASRSPPRRSEGQANPPTVESPSGRHASSGNNPVRRTKVATLRLAPPDQGGCKHGNTSTHKRRPLPRPRWCARSWRLRSRASSRWVNLQGRCVETIIVCVCIEICMQTTM